MFGYSDGRCEGPKVERGIHCTVHNMQSFIPLIWKNVTYEW